MIDSSSSPSLSLVKGPFSEHIIDAIKLNLTRSLRYARLSKGLSLPLSFGLIAFEIIILPLAYYYDFSEKFWKRAGLDVMSEDFIDMKEVPNFKDKATHIPSGCFNLKKVWKWRAEVHTLHRNKEWKQAYDLFLNLRASLKGEAAVYPLVWHFMESAHRANALTILATPKIDNAILRERFLKRRYCFIFWQMVGLEGALILDFFSWPLRRKGLLLYHQDIPEIPVPNVP